VSRIAAVLFVATAGFSASAWQGAADPCASIQVRDARCSAIQVPENRTGPSTRLPESARSGQAADRTIPIRFVVLPATGESPLPDPIFFLAGGPGQAATDLARGFTNNPLRARRDIVLVDQRGTGGSNPLMCDFYRPEDEASGRFADFLPIDRVRACRADLERVADLTQYTTAASVADLEAVRAHLGYERINLAGGSYGTRLALEYARTHGARVRTMALDGAVAPPVAAPAGFGVSAQQALDGILDECLADAACAQAFPEVRTRATELFVRLRTQPMDVRLPNGGTTVTLTADHVAEALRRLTYTTQDASRVPLLIEQAHAGDASGFLESLRAQRRSRVLGGLYLSITCAEDVPFADPALVARDRATYLGDYRYRQQHAACAEWPRGAAPEASRTPVRSPIPTLLVTGALDPATPPSFAEEVAATLPNSLLLKLPSGGHGFGGLQGLDCVNRIRDRFIEQGSVKGIDTACLAQVRRHGFVLQ
jgi:pimeloyl-ACP methyl ester carboxylesterase